MEAYTCIGSKRPIAASMLYCSENAFHIEFEEKKSVDFARTCLSDPRFTDHLLFETIVFAAPMGDLEKQFLLYVRM